MKFRYYITDLFDSVVRGTNSENAAKEYSQLDEYFVVDTERGVWITSPISEEEITEIKYTETSDGAGT